MSETDRLIAVVGATGTGKSDLSLDIADAIAAQGRTPEIVNADAMQLYRGMDIGTAKLPEGERRGHPHHLLDTLDVTEESTVADYQDLARATIGGILARDAVPILVGGSGLYVSSVLYDFQFPGRSADVRDRLEADLDEVGPAELHRRLRDLDPVVAERVGPYNGRRIVRALEVIEVSGRSAPSRLPDAPVLWKPASVIGASVERAALVERLDARVLAMWEAGLPDEVAGLLQAGLRGSPTASRAIGYAQATAELDGAMTRAAAIEQAQALTRRYARRQVSWFKRYPDVHWIDPGDRDARSAAIGAVIAD